ncbi:uncharacterized protein LOC129750926 [Uranotaenia lowii]|uniref:uncharacterized protein LOC129750926 n=1 Tax=Uranotaenia lowii TaxID=190385 RepID=UPI00247AB1FE|nr:uncharacterized protein LOC129750926 [Uranotaenia lowii]
MIPTKAWRQPTSSFFGSEMIAAYKTTEQMIDTPSPTTNNISNINNKITELPGHLWHGISESEVGFPGNMWDGRLALRDAILIPVEGEPSPTAQIGATMSQSPRPPSAAWHDPGTPDVRRERAVRGQPGHLQVITKFATTHHPQFANTRKGEHIDTL